MAITERFYFESAFYLSKPGYIHFLVPAVVIIEKVEEIRDSRGIETGKLHIKWIKSNGGDEIDKFLIECKAGSFLISETVSFISGQVDYEHNTSNVVQGTSVYVTIYAINSAGNSSTSSIIVTSNKVFLILIVPIIENHLVELHINYFFQLHRFLLM